MLSRVFSATPILRDSSADDGPATNPVGIADDDPSTNLVGLADSYTSSVLDTDGTGDWQVQVTTSVTNLRSFTQSMDYYYVLQEVDYRSGPIDAVLMPGTANAQLGGLGSNPLLFQTSPASVGCTTTTTSGVSYSVGGTAGWNQMQGLYAALSGGVDFTNSQTLACPDMIISNQSNPDTATPSWSYKQGQNYGNNSLVTFYNQWIWQVDWASYTPAQSEQQVSVASQAAVTYVTLPFPPSQIPVTANLTTVVPLPFGDTFALQPPTVASVSPTCVVPGQGFAIAGSGLYPNLVTGVTIGGVDAPQYAATSDTAVSVVAPVVSQATGQYPVAVQTAQGVSNTNVEIEIPSDGQCP